MSSFPPTDPTLIFNAEFSDYYIDVNGSFDQGELIAWPHGGPAVNQVWTLKNSGTGYHLLSTVLKDQNGNWLKEPKTVYAVANKSDPSGPIPGETIRGSGSSTGESNPQALLFQLHFVGKYGSWQIYTYRNGTHQFLTLEDGNSGTKLRLYSLQDKLRQLWKFRAAEPGLKLGPGQGQTSTGGGSVSSSSGVTLPGPYPLGPGPVSGPYPTDF